MIPKLSATQIAWRAAQDITDGAYVNLGIGFPEMVAKFQPPGRQAIFHTMYPTTGPITAIDMPFAPSVVNPPCASSSA